MENFENNQFNAIYLQLYFLNFYTLLHEFHSLTGSHNIRKNVFKLFIEMFISNRWWHRYNLINDIQN